MDLRNRRRLQAALIAAIFAAPVIAAMLLTLAGWTPRGRSYGQPIRPERDLASVPVKLADGRTFSWSNHDGVWTLVALPGPDCAERCLRQLDLAHRAQITLGKQTDKLLLLYLGDPPSGPASQGFAAVWTLAGTASHELDDLRAHARDSVSAVLVSPKGEALTRYPANFDAEGLRRDLKKVVR
ncbi:MAG: hypothetical protein OJF55_002054 [Rhodanobacteraceae bacterium]|jgi:cytochrome oxidase Cu insertion factor (SCO1/SenC/PrrC family)|nr:MAG: hypothetical protein OJF55_002054 [Rhodanobacteraceae bacterium]